VLDHLINIQPKFKSELLHAVNKLVLDVESYDKRYAMVGFHRIISDRLSLFAVSAPRFVFPVERGFLLG